MEKAVWIVSRMCAPRPPEPYLSGLGSDLGQQAPHDRPAGAFGDRHLLALASQLLDNAGLRLARVERDAGRWWD
jgi:hypothetical protein